MRICENCGQEYDEHLLSCPHCGAIPDPSALEDATALFDTILADDIIPEFSPFIEEEQNNSVEESPQDEDTILHKDNSSDDISADHEDEFYSPAVTTDDNVLFHIPDQESVNGDTREFDPVDLSGVSIPASPSSSASGSHESHEDPERERMVREMYGDTQHTTQETSIGDRLSFWFDDVKNSLFSLFPERKRKTGTVTVNDQNNLSDPDSKKLSVLSAASGNEQPYEDDSESASKPETEEYVNAEDSIVSDEIIDHDEVSVSEEVTAPSEIESEAKDDPDEINTSGENSEPASISSCEDEISDSNDVETDTKDEPSYDSFSISNMDSSQELLTEDHIETEQPDINIPTSEDAVSFDNDESDLSDLSVSGFYAEDAEVNDTDINIDSEGFDIDTSATTELNMRETDSDPEFNAEELSDSCDTIPDLQTVPVVVAITEDNTEVSTLPSSISDDTVIDEIKETASNSESPNDNNEELGKDPSLLSISPSYSDDQLTVPVAEDIRNEVRKDDSTKTTTESDFTHLFVNDADKESKLLRPRGLNKGVVITIALLLIGALIYGVFGYYIPKIKAEAQEAADREAAYLELVSGTWMSDVFIYADEAHPSREVLTLGKDYTYLCEIWTSSSDREAFDPEIWSVTDSNSGTYYLELDTGSIRVSYTGTDGKEHIYRRFVREVSANKLILREYYNENLTEYFDVVFERYTP